MADPERATDRHGRPLYRYDEVPPPDVGFAVWRGKTTMPGPPAASNGASGHPNGPCLAGWLESGAWWLHCLTCRLPRGSRAEEK